MNSDYFFLDITYMVIVSSRIKDGFSLSVAELAPTALELHKNIPGVELPYWEVMETETRPMYECFARGGFVTRITNISGLTPTEMGDITQSGFESYLRQGTFGQLPVDDQQESRAVLAKMLSGFSPTQTIVSVYDAKEKRLAGGCIVNLGQGDRSVREAVGKSDSHLATLYSYNFNGALLPNVPEKNATCYTRFWMPPNEELLTFLSGGKELFMYKRFCVTEILSGMARAAWYAMAENGRTHELGLFDTIDIGVLNMTIKHYGAVPLADTPRPTDTVKAPNPLHWHFDVEPASVGLFEPNKQLELALAADESLGPKQNVDWNDFRKKI